MKRIVVLLLAVAIPWLMTSSTLGLTVAAMSGCGVFEDSCDKIKNECEDDGGTPKNCKQKQSLASDDCECECVFEEDA